MAGLRISRSKVITFDIKVTIKISCLMDFSDYPFDDHTCNFQVTALSVTAHILVSILHASVYLENIPNSILFFTFFFGRVGGTPPISETLH